MKYSREKKRLHWAFRWTCSLWELQGMRNKTNDISKKKPNKSRWDIFAGQLMWSLNNKNCSRLKNNLRPTELRYVVLESTQVWTNQGIFITWKFFDMERWRWLNEAKPGHKAVWRNSTISFGGKTRIYTNSKISGRMYTSVTVVIAGL